MLEALSFILGCAAYRLRGGGWFAFGSDVPPRIIWGATLCLCFILWHLQAPLYLLALIPLAYASMLVPHAFCQNMGRWPNPQRKWPAFFLPTLTQEQWDAMSPWKRTLYDMGGMAGVGLFRGLIVFLPFLAFRNPLRVILAVIITTLGMPLAYLLGKYTPFTFGDSLQKNTAMWGEFWTGGVWSIAVGIL